jgi:REP element-mobilizing transposase RayT
MKGYDYSWEGAYFVTVCTKDREHLLISKPVRKIIQKAWNDLPYRFSDIKLDEFIIMPNHIHGIIWIVGAPLGAPQNETAVNQGATKLNQDATARLNQGVASSAPTLGHIVRVFKSISAIAINQHLERQENPVWQRNYFERIIRDDQELNRIRQYIQDNPKNWEEDPENI